MIQYDAINYSCQNQMIIQYDQILIRLATKYNDNKPNGSINSKIQYCFTSALRYKTKIEKIITFYVLFTWLIFIKQ
jgi:hypothetical protein